MKLYLKIGGEFRLMKMDAASEIALNFTHDNLENPTNYVSENSYSLKLPKCPENNKLFSNFLHLDSVIVSGGYDPTHRMDYMAMSDEGEVISTGTAVVKSIDGDGYKLSLLGSLSHIFTKLLNAGYDTEKAAEDEGYYLMIDWLKKKKVQQGNTFILQNGENFINSKLVYASWMIDHPLFNPFVNLRLKTMYGLAADNNISETDALIASIVGFSPLSQGSYDNFENNVWVEKGTIISGGQSTQAQSVAFLPVLCSKRDAFAEPIEGVEAEGGVIDIQMLEFRSYYQKPFVYISALWQLFKNEFEAITGGYELELDDRWFSEDNVELRNLVCMLPNLTIEESGIIDTLTPAQTPTVNHQLPYRTSVYDSTQNPINGGSVSGLANLMWINSGQMMLKAGANRLDINTTLTFSSLNQGGHVLYYSAFNPYVVEVNVRDAQTSQLLQQRRVLVFMLPYDGMLEIDTLDDGYGYMQVLINDWIANDSGDIIYTYYSSVAQFSIKNSILINSSEEKAVSIEAHVKFRNNYTPFMYFNGTTRYYYWGYTNQQVMPMSMSVRTNGSGEKIKSYRSHSPISLERIFKYQNPFNILLNYAKLHHLIWTVDDTERTVKVLRASDYYKDRSEEGMMNITPYIDGGKDVSISPLSWNEHAVVFNFDEPNVDGVSGYSERYGQSYGSKVIITRNNINRDRRELLKGITASVNYSVTILPIGHLLVLRDASKAEYIEAPPMPANISKGVRANISNNFYYRHGNTSWPTILYDGWRPYAYISDDSDKETQYNRFCWHGIDVIGNDLPCLYRPVFNTVNSNGLSVLFAAVREQYTGAPDEPTEYLYEHCWKDYVEEVYNQQNKTVELYININNSLLAKLRRNPLVQIGNCIYLLMEIKDWTERTRPCKCKLRQIFDIGKLTGGVYL